MRTFKLTTSEGIEICVECDEFYEDIREDSLTAKRGGLPVLVFPRTSVLCWEEVATPTEPAPRSMNRAGSLSRKSARHRA